MIEKKQIPIVNFRNLILESLEADDCIILGLNKYYISSLIKNCVKEVALFVDLPSNSKLLEDEIGEIQLVINYLNKKGIEIFHIFTPTDLVFEKGIIKKNIDNISNFSYRNKYYLKIKNEYDNFIKNKKDFIKELDNIVYTINIDLLGSNLQEKKNILNEYKKIKKYFGKNENKFFNKMDDLVKKINNFLEKNIDIFLKKLKEQLDLIINKIKKDNGTWESEEFKKKGYEEIDELCLKILNWEDEYKKLKKEYQNKNKKKQLPTINKKLLNITDKIVKSNLERWMKQEYIKHGKNLNIGIFYEILLLFDKNIDYYKYNKARINGKYDKFDKKLSGVLDIKKSINNACFSIKAASNVIDDIIEEDNLSNKDNPIGKYKNLQEWAFLSYEEILFEKGIIKSNVFYDYSIKYLVDLEINKIILEINNYIEKRNYKNNNKSIINNLEYLKNSLFYGYNFCKWSDSDDQMQGNTICVKLSDNQKKIKYKISRKVNVIEKKVESGEIDLTGNQEEVHDLKKKFLNNILSKNEGFFQLPINEILSNWETSFFNMKDKDKGFSDFLNALKTKYKNSYHHPKLLQAPLFVQERMVTILDKIDRRVCALEFSRNPFKVSAEAKMTVLEDLRLSLLFGEIETLEDISKVISDWKQKISFLNDLKFAKKGFEAATALEIISEHRTWCRFECCFWSHSDEAKKHTATRQLVDAIDDLLPKVIPDKDNELPPPCPQWRPA